MHWEDVPDTVDRWHGACVLPSEELWAATRALPTLGDVGVYWSPDREQAAVFSREHSEQDEALVKAAIADAIGRVREEPLTLAELTQDPWVKVAYSPALRGIGEALNFFPGQYPGGLPNRPSPIAAMLTTGLLGAGLGWGAGKILGGVLPRGWGGRLGRTGAVLGGAAGVAPGMLWAAANLASRRPLNDPGLLDTAPDALPLPAAGPWTQGTNALPSAATGSTTSQDLETVLRGLQPMAMHKRGSTFGGGPEVTDVHIDHLGRTLWNLGASPQLASTALGTVYAASQLPDPRQRPGLATGNQLGQLAMRAAGDYAKGYLGGAVLNTVIGTPLPASSYGGALAALGVISSVVGNMWGR